VRLRKAKNLIESCRYLGRDLKAGSLPEIESGMEITGPRRLLVETSERLHYARLKTEPQKYILGLRAAEWAAVHDGSRDVTGPPVLLR
jgi:hypothetical protein